MRHKLQPTRFHIFGQGHSLSCSTLGFLYILQLEGRLAYNQPNRMRSGLIRWTNGSLGVLYCHQNCNKTSQQPAASGIVALLAQPLQKSSCGKDQQKTPAST
jgi:hypothetical protein